MVVRWTVRRGYPTRTIQCIKLTADSAIAAYSDRLLCCREEDLNGKTISIG
jgi:hypothetical protein